jgi:hypothetical protein
MVYTIIKTDNTVASVKISSILTVKIVTRNKNKCHREKVLPEKLTVGQLLFLFLVFYRTCWVITNSTTG